MLGDTTSAPELGDRGMPEMDTETHRAYSPDPLMVKVSANCLQPCGGAAGWRSKASLGMPGQAHAVAAPKGSLVQSYSFFATGQIPARKYPRALYGSSGVHVRRR